MPKYLNEWNSLNDSIPSGKGLHARRDYAHSIAINLHYYASIIGLILSSITFLMAVV